jgi:hypothetical protein
MAKVTYVEGGVMAWTKAALGDHEPEIFNVDDGFPFETIAKLDPDVILAVNAYPYIADHWNELNAIALSSGTWAHPSWTRGSRASRRSARRPAARRRPSS